MFRKDTARFRESFGPDGWAPPARPVPVRRRSGVGVGGDDDGPALGTGTGRRGWQTGSVGVSTLSPPHPPTGALACPDRTSQVAAPTGSTGVRSAVRRRTEAVRVGAAAGDVIGSSGSPGGGGGGPPVRPGNPGPVAPDDRPSVRHRALEGPAAHSPEPTSSRPRGANRGRSLAGRLRKAGRATAARTPPSRMVRGQTVTTVSAGSTSVHEDPVSAERVTASRTSWTCNASAKEGAGSVPVAIASMRSRIWCVKECS
jgi:hypothetical protein